MSKKISIKWDEEFYIAGVISAVRDYKLVFDINTFCQLDLKRIDDIEMIVEDSTTAGLFEEAEKENKNEPSKHSAFQFYDENSKKEYSVISNSGSKGFLLADQKKFDYFFLLRVESHKKKEFEKMIKSFAEIETVSAAVILELKNVQSKINLFI
ncbi:MAG: IPExxxVDY family protein [Bacteroidota bacterium]|jgi:hypothetical protein